MKNDQLKEELASIRTLIMKNRIKQAMENLLKFVTSMNDRHLRDFLILTYSSYNNFETGTLLNLDKDDSKREKIVSALLGFLSEIEESIEGPKTVQNSDLNKADKRDRDRELLERINGIGIVDVTSGLKQTKYDPSECLQRVNKKLYFMGILGSKWVKSSFFSKFIVKTQANHGEVKFLLINPLSQAYDDLYHLRDGSINTEPLDLFYIYSQKYSCLKVRLFSTLPSFRMAFLDDNTLALSVYQHEKTKYFNSNLGWDNPHIIIDSSNEWSIYKAFEDIFQMIWSTSIDLEEYKRNL